MTFPGLTAERKLEIIERVKEYERRFLERRASEAASHLYALHVSGLTEEGLLYGRSLVGKYLTMRPGVVVFTDTATAETVDEREARGHAPWMKAAA
jgi:hypothetical protein